jgi:phosphoenolpyruvate-protein phosphotransferase (PTS system enzyme I)
MTHLEGIPISPGLAYGVAVVYDFEVGRRLEMPRRDLTHTDIESESDRLDEALARSNKDLHQTKQDATQHGSRIQALELLSVHLTMTSEITGQVKQYIRRDLVNVEQALESVIRDWVQRLHRIDNAYLRQREQDVRDVGRRISRYLAGALPLSQGPLPEGSVIVARELLPSEAVELAHCGIVAIVSELGGMYSHTAIVARALHIPAVTGIAQVTSKIHPGARLLVDGRMGSVTIASSKLEEDRFVEQAHQYRTAAASPTPTDCTECITQDGVEIALLANIGGPDEVRAAKEDHLAGVGLFRTEFLFLESQERPTVQMQSEMYERTAHALGGLPLVIRTFDLGGDKLPPFLRSDTPETRSSLHLRGLRFLLAERELLDAQLRAILGVAQTSNVRVLFPMVAGSDDLARAIAQVDRIVGELDLPHTPLIGAMIETPAALYALDEIFDLADFVALGTNDLTQYMLATDRDMAKAADDCTALHPAILRAIKQVSDEAEKRQCPVCVCGEEAGDAAFASLLVGLGVRELSVSPGRGDSVRRAIRDIDSQTMRDMADFAISCRTPGEVRELLQVSDGVK